MDKYGRLTESAEYALEDIVSEYRDNILVEVYEFPRTQGKEISVKDVYEAKSRIDKNTANKVLNERINRKKDYFNLFVFMGILYSVIGVVIYLIQNTNMLLYSKHPMGIWLFMAGLLIVFFSLFFLRIQKHNTKNEYRVFPYNNYNSNYDYKDYKASEHLVVKLWDQIEQIGRRLMFFDQKDDRMEFYSVIDYLLSISDDVEKIKLKEILRIRNEIVHDGKKHSKTKIEETIAMEYLIVEKLENLYRKRTRNKKEVNSEMIEINENQARNS